MLTLTLLAVIAFLLLSVAVLVLLFRWMKGERDAWRRTAWRSAQAKKIGEDDTRKAHAVAADLARRGFRAP